MNLDTVFWISGTVAEAAVIALLFYRQVWRTLPIFVIYSIWTLAGSIAAYTVFHVYSHSVYLSFYLAGIVIDSVLLFGVLVELGWSILRPLRSSLPRISLVFIAFLILALGTAIWPFANLSGMANGQSHELADLMRLQQTFSILRVLVFLVLAGCSHLLSIGWRNRELQVATGLGFTSLVGVAVAMLHTHQTTRDQYSHLNQFVVASYLCSLLYWIVSFAQQEEQRREFSPRMQSLLLAMAGSARTTRMGMEEMPGPRKRGRL